MLLKRGLRPFVALALSLALSLALARADLARAGNAKKRAPEKVFKEECGACHMPFPSYFLPAASWRAIMSGLEDHFGEDASLDEEVRKELEQFLVDHSARWKAGKNPPLRITELRWFRGEHGSMTRYRKRLSKRLGHEVKMSECTACHRDAERGYFDDD